MIREIIWRLLAALRARKLDRQAEAEMRLHLDMEIEAGMRRGLDRDEAMRAARLRVGAIPSALEQVRDQRSLGRLSGTFTDLRQACNTLRRQPGFALVALAALSFSVAASTLIFTIADGVLWRPLPYPEPDRLVRVYEWTPRNPKFPISILNYLEDRRFNSTLENIALYTGEDMQLMHGERPERLTAVRITDSFLPTLGVKPVLGRNFLPSEMLRSARVVILSNALWSARFQRDPGIAGKTIRLNRETWTVIGVLPAGFQHVGGAYRSPLQGETVALWTPLGLDLPPNGLRFWHFTNAVARLRPGVSLQAAQQDLNLVLDELALQFPDAYEKARARVEPLAAEVLGQSRRTIELLMAAGILVVLIACVNIAGLCVARVLARRHELAIRQALGAEPWRLVRVVLSENLVLGFAGGAFGIGLAAVLVPALRIMIPLDFPRLHEVGLSAHAAEFAIGAAVLASIIAGLVPAFRQARIDPHEGLAEDSRTSSAIHSAHRLRSGLVVCEVALACVLCFGTVLLVRSSIRLGARDHGFDPQGVLTFQLTLPLNAYQKPEQITALYGELLHRWKQIPMVKAAGLASNIPWTGYDENTSFDIVGRQPRAGETLQARFQAAAPGFFETLKVRLLQGRFIDEHDSASTPRVIVVNGELVRRHFPEGNPIGQVLDIWGEKCKIAGVTEDVRDRPSDAGAEPAFWWPIAQQPFGQVHAVVRTDGDALSLISPVVEAVRAMDRELPLAAVTTMEEIAGRAFAERRFTLRLFQGFAVLAVVLAAIGVYGLLTFVVHQRRKELGIRMAFGATRSAIVATVLRHGVRLGLFGISAGLLLSPAMGRALSAILFGVTETDVVTLLIAPLLIMAALLIACFVPAWKASRAEPVSVLRNQ